jgi:UDP-N-acetylmuramate dehydrogenase
VLYSLPVPPRAFLIQENIPLAPYTTFRIGGPARFFCEVSTKEELLEAVTFARKRSLPIFVLGGGSNLLVTDRGFDGLVLRVKIEGAINIDGYRDQMANKTSVTYDVPGGMDWDAFVLRVAEAGVTGIECLAGIPGLVGGAPIQNIGAYGQEVSTSILLVHVLDLETLQFVTLPAELCGFAYRRSIFNTTHRDRYIVTSVTFQLDLHATPTLRYADLKDYFSSRTPAPKPIEIYHAVRSIRQGKGMLIVEGEADCRSAGSFFKNPVVPTSVLHNIAATLTIPVDKIPHWAAGEDLVKLPAAWLLERAGFVKGFQLGEAGISSRHTLALINRGHATFADIALLRETIRREVASRFGIQLEQEPVQVGL